MGMKRKTYFGQAAVNSSEYVISARVGTGSLSRLQCLRNADEGAGGEYELEQA